MKLKFVTATLSNCISEVSVWDPHGIVVQEEIEKVQNRAARIVAGNYNFETGSMTRILEQLG